MLGIADAALIIGDPALRIDPGSLPWHVYDLGAEWVEMTGLPMVFAITVSRLGPLDKGPAVAGYVGLLLMGGSYIAIGVMASSFTRNQVVSLIIAFGICFALFLFGKVLPFVPDALKPIVSFLSTDTHFENVSRGVLDSRDVIYYLSVVVVTLLIATTSLESRKWK